MLKLAQLGHPILGDGLYGHQNGPVLKGKGLFLRALSLEFKHPITQAPLAIEMEEPEKFENQRQREARRWTQFRSATLDPRNEEPSDS